MGQNFCASESDRDIFSPITCIFIARISFLSNAMSASVTVGLMTLCTAICCPCVFAPTEAIPPPNAVATTIPATNAAAKPAASVILVFMFTLTLARIHGLDASKALSRELENCVIRDDDCQSIDALAREFATPGPPADVINNVSLCHRHELTVFHNIRPIWSSTTG